MKFIIIVIDGKMYRIDERGHITDVELETYAM